MAVPGRTKLRPATFARQASGAGGEPPHFLRQGRAEP
jgi:hypothetical protein